MEGENFGREKDKTVPLEAKQEQKNAKGGRWSVLSPGILPLQKDVVCTYGRVDGPWGQCGRFWKISPHWIFSTGHSRP